MKNKLTYNTIPHQNKQTSNSLTIAEWNDIINVLRIQTNNIVDYLNILQEEIVRASDNVARASSNMQIFDAWAKAIEDRVDAIEQEIEKASDILDNLLDKDGE